MKFVMNYRTWEIKKVSQEEIMNYYHEEDTVYYYGQTHFKTKEIWLSDDLPKEQIPITLHHELMHCYIRMYITSQELEYNEESLCDISANANIEINDIIEEYMENVVK